MATYKLNNIKLKTSRLQAIVAVKRYFNLYDLPVTESVAKLDEILREGLTLEYQFQVDEFEALNAFTYDFEKTLSEIERWEKEQEGKVKRACQWYNTLSEEEQEFVDTLRRQMVPRG